MFGLLDQVFERSLHTLMIAVAKWPRTRIMAALASDDSRSSLSARSARLAVWTSAPICR